jgi:prolyl-tRNA editing enzyme YbaK/EbsC (Cys-tRNA(Pro) deacylase)
MTLSETHDARTAAARDNESNPEKELEMVAIQDTGRPAVGDVIVVGGHSVGGERTMGEILEIRGESAHERYRIRWEDGHESIFHPADGEATIHHYSPHGASVEIMRTLREQKIEFEPRRHPRTQTAKDEARVLHAAPEHIGKTLVVNAAGEWIRVVIPASERLSLPRLRDAIGVDELRFATEEELAAVYPAFELGAVPPFGGPERDRVVVDRRVADLETVIVEAGSHSDSILIATADLVRITKATVADVIAD